MTGPVGGIPDGWHAIGIKIVISDGKGATAEDYIILAEFAKLFEVVTERFKDEDAWVQRSVLRVSQRQRSDP